MDHGSEDKLPAASGARQGRWSMPWQGPGHSKRGRLDPALSACIIPRPMALTLSKIHALEQQGIRSDIADFRVGDTVAVHYQIVEGDKLRVQIFRGVVIKRHRAGLRSTLTVRKTSFNVGVERIFMVHSPRLQKIEVVSRGVVRKARLLYLRDLEGKAARVQDEKDA